MGWGWKIKILTLHWFTGKIQFLGAYGSQKTNIYREEIAYPHKKKLTNV